MREGSSDAGDCEDVGVASRDSKAFEAPAAFGAAEGNGGYSESIMFFFFQGPAVSQKSILDTQTEFGYFEERIETRIHVVSEAVRVYI